MVVVAERDDCIFCGRDDLPMTKEHVLAEGLSEQVLPRHPIRVWSGFDLSAVTDIAEIPELTPDLMPDMTWTTDVLDIEAKIVCRPCNNDWMSQIEQRAHPLLAPLIQGRPVSLSGQSRKKLAAWAFKTSIAFQMLDPASFEIQREHRQWLYISKRPSPASAVWLASFEGSPQRYTSYQSWLLGEPEEISLGLPSAFCSAIILRRALFFVFLLPFENRPTIRIPMELQPFIYRLWPPRSGDFLWESSSPPMTDKMVPEFANRLANVVTEPPWDMKIIIKHSDAPSEEIPEP